MSANILVFDEWAGSGRGLMARPILPNNVVALKANISEISYEIHRVNEVTPVETGDLDVDVVMFDSPQPWKYDSDGYTFLWAAPGDMWDTPNEIRRIIIRFLIEAPGTQLDGKVFLLVYEVRTVDPVNDTAPS